MGLNGFYWVSLDLRRSVQGSMVLNGFYPFFKGVTGLHWVLLGFTGFYWVLLGFTGSKWISEGLFRGYMGYNGF